MSLIFDALQRVEYEHVGVGSAPPFEPFELIRRADLREASRPVAAPNGPIDEARRRVPQEPVAPPVPAQISAPELPELFLPSGLRRVAAALRVAMPFVQAILPLIDGNAGTAVSSHLTASPEVPPAAPLPAQLDFTPIQNTLDKLETRHRELRDQVLEQNASLQVVEDQLEMVRNATDRNTIMQQELTEDLKSVGNKINVVSMMVLGLLAISTGTSFYLFLHVFKVLR